MSDAELTSFLLPTPMREAAEQIAREEDISLGQVLRNALSSDLNRRRKGSAKTPARADEQLLAPLRSLLAQDLADAWSWRDLQNRLQAKGYSMREAGGGLALHRWPDGPRVCKASDLGASYSDLMRRFGCAFPNHSHTWVAGHVLKKPDTLAGPPPQSNPISPS